MKAGGGRAKGNAFERKIAAMIVAHFMDRGITKKDCYRTPLSGGHLYAKDEDPGDLVISPKLRRHFPFHVECKHYGEVKLAQFLVPVGKWKKTWHCTKWMKQVTASNREKLEPLLVFKENFGEVLVAMPTAYFDDREPLIYPSLLFKYRNEPWMVLRFRRMLRSL